MVKGGGYGAGEGARSRQVGMAHKIHLEGSFLLEFYKFNGNKTKIKGLLFL